MLRYALFLVCILFCSPAYAQDDEIPVSYKKDSNGSITLPEVDSESPDITDKIQLNLNLQWSPPRVSFPDYWDSYANKPKIRYTYEYEGFYGLVQKQCIRLAQKFYRKALRNTWEQSHLSQSEIDHCKRQHGLMSGDPIHPWWQREYFFEHLPVEKGGSSVQRIVIGDTHELISAGPLSLSNSGKMSWSGWKLSVEPDRDLPSKKLRRDLDGTTEEDSPRYRDPQQLSLGISPPSGNLYTGENWTVSGSMKLSVRANTLIENRTSVEGKVEISGYTGYGKTQFVAIEIKGRARPFIDDYSVEVSVALLTF